MNLLSLSYEIQQPKIKYWWESSKWYGCQISSRKIFLSNLEITRGVYSLLMCYDTSGSWAEGRMGGPSGVGKGHTSLAICPAGPGQVVPPASPKHWFQQPWTVPRGKNAQGNSTEFHGIWSTSEFVHFLIILSKCSIEKLIITDLALLFLDGHAFETSGSCKLHRITRERRPYPPKTLNHCIQKQMSSSSSS